MNYINFSKSYHVRMLTERDIPLILALCEKNTQFYEHCPPFVTEESIRDDMCALPQRKMDEPQDKYYLGFFDDAEQLVAVMDFIDHYRIEKSHAGLYGRCNEPNAVTDQTETGKTCVKNAKYTVIVKQAAGAQIEPRRL